jgi:hypothetical protein
VTEEYNRLKEILLTLGILKKAKFSEQEYDISFLEKYNIKNFKDLSLFDWEDRCFTFNLNMRMANSIQYQYVKCLNSLLFN